MSMHRLFEEMIFEALNGSLTNKLINSKISPYSRGYLNKIKYFDETKFRIKCVMKIKDAFPSVEFFDENLITKENEQFILPDFNKEIYESFEEGVAPIILYILKDSSDPFSIENYKSKDLNYLLSSFPYSKIHSTIFWTDQENELYQKYRADYISDIFIIFFSCCYIDIDTGEDINYFFEKHIVNDIANKYDGSYHYKKYIESRIDEIKKHKKINRSVSLEKLFNILADDFGSDTDSARTLIKRWRAGVSTPKPQKIGSFMYTLSDGTLRGFFSEMLLFSMYVSIQLIHKKAESIDPQYWDYFLSCFNVERFSYWVNELREHYKDVLEARAKEIADEAH